MTASIARPSASGVNLTRQLGVAVITLDGDRTRNALDASTAAALVEACDSVDADDSIGAVIVRGANGTFCSGALRGALSDLSAATPHLAYEALDGLYAAFTRVGRLRVPSIACIEGAAVGAGLNLALATDLRVAAYDAQLISGFAPLGIHPGGGHLHLLERAAGRQAAAALGVFGLQVSASQAESLGLVWAAVPPSTLDRVLADLTNHLAADPALARALKTSLILTAGSLDQWAAATEIERARQLWSLSRPRPESNTVEPGATATSSLAR